MTECQHRYVVDTIDENSNGTRTVRASCNRCGEPYSVVTKRTVEEIHAEAESQGASA